MKQPKYSAGRRLSRRLGLTRNPLYRPVDRLDGAVRLSAVLLLLVVVATSTWAGMAAFARTSAAVARQRQQLHQVTVVLAADVPAGGGLEPSTARSGVQAKWTLPDGSVRAGTVYPRAMASRGDSVSVWMNAFDDPVPAPAEQSDLLVRAGLRGLALSSLGCLALWLMYRMAQRQFARRRDTAWTKEWLLISGRWRNRSK